MRTLYGIALQLFEYVQFYSLFAPSGQVSWCKLRQAGQGCGK